MRIISFVTDLGIFVFSFINIIEISRNKRYNIFDMISSFDIVNLQNLLKDFYTAVGIRISVFDDEFRLVTEYPAKPPAFCANIRSNANGLNACRQCDIDAFNRAKKLREPHIYTCHAGLTEAITPIPLGGGVLGYAILAHMLPGEDRQERIKIACLKAKSYGVEESQSMNALSFIESKSNEQINAAVRILDAIASYVQIKNLAKWKSDTVANDIEEYIASNLGNKITSEILCKKFHCSRTVLYHISVQSFGMSINRYINFRRTEYAKTLLTEGKSIAEVAEIVGFRDYSYFCRVFRREAGVTPANFVKNNC